MTAVAHERPTATPSTAPTSTTRARADVVLAVIVAGAVGCVGLWWQNTPSLNGLGDWLTNAGRITGLLAGYAMVVLVALMARIPPLERGIGADKLARWHAMGGRYSVSLVVAHGLLITWGYAVTAHTSVVSQGKTLLLSYPDVLMATVAGLLLVGVGITSARAARKRLSYETWFYLHFYTYLAIALAFSHQFASGAEFIDNGLARWVWGALYAAVGAAIGDLWWVSSPYSLSAPVSPTTMRITVKDLGEHSRSLAHLKPGTRILTEGPYGAMTADLRTQRKVLLLAGGVGITPLRALFETLPAAPGDLTLLYRSSAAKDVVFTDELEAIAAQRQANLHIVTGRRAELGGDPLSAASLTAALPDLAQHDVYLCGPDGMTSAATRALSQAGVPKRRIHHESFAL
jgi:predicted ferric reductase